MASFSTFNTLADALVHFKIGENRKNIFPDTHNSLKSWLYVAEKWGCCEKMAL